MAVKWLSNGCQNPWEVGGTGCAPTAWATMSVWPYVWRRHARRPTSTSRIPAVPYSGDLRAGNLVCDEQDHGKVHAEVMLCYVGRLYYLLIAALGLTEMTHSVGLDMETQRLRKC